MTEERLSEIESGNRATITVAGMVKRQLRTSVTTPIVMMCISTLNAITEQATIVVELTDALRNANNRIAELVAQVERSRELHTYHMADCGHGVRGETRVDANGRSYCPACAGERIAELESEIGRLQQENDAWHRELCLTMSVCPRCSGANVEREPMPGRLVRCLECGLTREEWLEEAGND